MERVQTGEALPEFGTTSNVILVQWSTISDNFHVLSVLYLIEQSNNKIEPYIFESEFRLLTLI